MTSDNDYTTIYRYDLPVTDTQWVDMPAGAQILPHVALSDRFAKDITIWAKVNHHAPMLPREISIVGTGNPVPRGMMDGPYIGTVQQRSMVWHVFEGVRA